MMGHYLPKEIRDVGLAGFSISLLASGSISNPFAAGFAVALAVGAVIAAVNRFPDVITEINGGVSILRRRS